MSGVSVDGNNTSRVIFMECGVCDDAVLVSGDRWCMFSFYFLITQVKYKQTILL